MRVVMVLGLAGCFDSAAGSPDATLASHDAASDGAAPGPCPVEMAHTGSTCMDFHEAPNVVGERPLVMYTFVQAEAWCGARGKRLCFDDEWQSACAGAAAQPYPYGTTRVPGTCNDNKVWRVYSQTSLNGWPSAASNASIATLDELVAAASASPAGTTAANHVMSLYQGTAAGANPGCAGDAGVFDLVGNVEEWTRRRDGGMNLFHGSLKGRYWAESRTCQSAVTSHGDNFRFYEIGFRCCADPL